jgi:malate dehydrogenase (oxaloacetate-decarboxylating)(NADP+)
MFMAAVHALCAQVTPEDLAQGSLYPPLARVREVSAHIAAAVARVVFDAGLAVMERPADLLAHVRSQMYEPRYVDYTRPGQ